MAITPETFMRRDLPSTLRLRFVASSLFVLLCGFTPQLTTSPPPPATVYRDEYGVPHIESPIEETAFRALGYEEARDGLFHIQANLARFRGESASVLGVGGGVKNFCGENVRNDALVKLYDLNMRDRGSEDDLKDLLFRSDAPPGRKNQLYKNLKAYAEGVDAYRLRLNAGNGLRAQETTYRDWLVSSGFGWVLTTPVDVFDVASAGSWAVNIAHFATAGRADNNPHINPCSQNCPAPVEPSEEEDPLGLYLEGVPQLGSKGFGWSFDYTAQDRFAAVMADQQGAFDPTFQGFPATQVIPTGFDDFGAGRWFAHLKVNQPKEPIDSYGYLTSGWGVFSNSFNDFVAVGGSTSAFNSSDTFLLRLEEQMTPAPSGLPSTPPRYYCYYDGAFKDFQIETVTVATTTGSKDVTVWWAPGLGLVVNTQHFWADRTTNWVIDPLNNSVRNNFYATLTDPSTQMPVLIAYRIPADPFVDGGPGGSDHLFRTQNGLYELMHARTVYDVQDEVIKHDLNRTPNIVAVDRDGRIFSTVTATMPERGLDCMGLPEPDDKFDLYDKTADREPVPARWDSDIAFDWQFDGSGSLKYLEPDGDGVASNSDYLPYVLFDPVTPSNNHPAQMQSGMVYENPGFVTASNDQIYFFYQKAFNTTTKLPVVCNTRSSPDNRILDNLFETGTRYHSRSATLSAATTNKYIIDFLIGAFWNGGIDAAEAVDFAWDNRNYADKDYPGYPDANGVEQDLGVEDLPHVVRSLKELEIELATVQAEAAREAAFFEDLWVALHAGGALDADYQIELGPGQTETVNLRDVWVDNQFTDANGVPRIFWYPDYGYAEYVDMPGQSALIDFFHEQTRVGGKSVADSGATLTQLEVDALTLAPGPVNPQGPEPVIPLLEGWAAEGYANTIGSEPAALYLQYGQGFLAAKNGWNAASNTIKPDNEYEEGHMWASLVNGDLISVPVRFPDTESLSAANQTLVDLGPTGSPPSPIDEEGRFNTGEHLLRPVVSYQALGSIVLSMDSLASLMAESGSAGRHGILRVPSLSQREDAGDPLEQPPYDALYSNVGTRTVKTPDQLSRADINALVRLFLVRMGGFSLEAGQGTDKVSRFDAWLLDMTQPPPYAWHYPLTRNLTRVACLRRLLLADEFNRDKFNGQRPEWGDLVRARIIDYTNTQRWPLNNGVPVPEGAACEGGFLREAPMLPDGPVTAGFSDRFWATAGSARPMFVMYPEDGGSPISYFCAYPGNRLSAPDSPHFAGLMDSWASGELVLTHKEDFKTAPFSTDPGLPPSPYQSPP